MLSIRGFALALALSLFAAACKPKAHLPQSPPPAVTPQAAPAQEIAEPDEPLAADQFTLPDDAPIDPAEEREALNHNCCDEMPADQVRAHVEPTTP